MDQVGDNVAHELGRFGSAPGLAPIVDAWEAAVGAEIARNAWPARLTRDGMLVVHAESATWAFELGHLERRIREALGAAAPPKIRFVVGPLPESAARDEPEGRSPRVDPSREHVAAAESLAAQIEDENLRKVVAKAVALSLARSAADRSLW